MDCLTHFEKSFQTLTGPQPAVFRLIQMSLWLCKSMEHVVNYVSTLSWTLSTFNVKNMLIYLANLEFQTAWSPLGIETHQVEHDSPGRNVICVVQCMKGPVLSSYKGRIKAYELLNLLFFFPKINIPETFIFWRCLVITLFYSFFIFSVIIDPSSLLADPIDSAVAPVA